MNSREAFYKSDIFCKKHDSSFEVYDKYFSKYKHKEITFVEVGVFEGGSLLLWRNFFGPNARIIGIDINPNAKKMEKYGFEIFIGDQSSNSFWNDFYSAVGNIDILLDDGGHYFDQQIVTLNQSIKHLNDGGTILIEDTHTSYMRNYFGPSKFSFVNYSKKIIDEINYRSGSISKNFFNSDFYSISFYESIVVFSKNIKNSKSKSSMIDNNKPNYISNYNSPKLNSSKFLAFIGKSNLLKNTIRKIYFKIIILKRPIFKITNNLRYKKYFRRFK
jgi:hypothetical protein